MGRAGEDKSKNDLGMVRYIEKYRSPYKWLIRARRDGPLVHQKFYHKERKEHCW